MRVKSFLQSGVELARANALISVIAATVLLAGIGAGGGYMLTSHKLPVPAVPFVKKAAQTPQVVNNADVGGTVETATTSTSNSAGQAVSNTPAKATTSQPGGTTKANTTSQPLLSGYSPTFPGLVASPSRVTMPSNGHAVNVSISNSNGTLMYRPSVSSISGLMLYVQEPYYIPPSGGAITQKSWNLMISRIDYSSGGSEYATVTSMGQSVKILVEWNPAPRFDLIKGSLARTDGPDTITHTATFSITPNNPYFGAPTLTMRLNSSSNCINTGELTRTTVYNGQNTFSMSCVVNRIPPFVPNTGMTLPPLPSESSFSIDVYGMVNGEFVRGPYPISYVLPSGFDR